MQNLYSDSVYQRIQEYGIIPLVTLENARDALLLGQALMECGLPIVEITFRTKAAEEAIKILKKEYPEILVGAGTVLTKATAKIAIQAGAEFILSPGIYPEVIQYCQDRNVLPFPGCMTPTDLELAQRLGLKCVKIFPAVPMGGLAMLKAISAPFPEMRYLATGGINNSNVKEYLEFPRMLASGGSWLIKKENLKTSNIENLKKEINQAITSMLDLRWNLSQFSILEYIHKTLSDTETLRRLTIQTSDFGRAVNYFLRIGFMEDVTFSEVRKEGAANQETILIKSNSKLVLHLTGGN